MSNVRWDPKVGKQVKAHREAKQLSRDGLARLIGLTTTTIYRIETGRQRVGREAARLLAAELDMSESVLLTPVAKVR